MAKKEYLNLDNQLPSLFVKFEICESTLDITGLSTKDKITFLLTYQHDKLSNETEEIRLLIDNHFKNDVKPQNIKFNYPLFNIRTDDIKWWYCNCIDYIFRLVRDKKISLSMINGYWYIKKISELIKDIDPKENGEVSIDTAFIDIDNCIDENCETSAFVMGSNLARYNEPYKYLFFVDSPITEYNNYDRFYLVHIQAEFK